MAIAAVTSLRHSYGGRQVLDGATLSIADGEKIGLVGLNGCGKSTLMRVLAGELVPDQGTTAIARQTRIGYLSQHPRLDPTKTMREEAATAFAYLDEANRELNEVFELMATATGKDLERLFKRQIDLDARIDQGGGHAVDHRIDAALHGLGFGDREFSTPVSSLSGGQKARLGLAKLLLEEPDLLLLDEPTNHLDIDGRRWLEEFLAEEFPGAVVVVSHDRWLLDRVVTRIVEIDRGVVREYPGNYEAFVGLRRERQLSEARVYEKQLDKIRSEEAYIRKYKAGQRAKQARGRETRLDRYKDEQLVDRQIELDVMHLELPTPPRVGDIVTSGEHLAKRYGERRLFDDLTLTVKPGDRIGIIGPNGAGKTTLVRTLLGDLEPDGGLVRKSPRLQVGWFRQTQDHLDLSLTTWEYLQSVIVALDSGARASEQQARNLAGAFLFSGPEQDKTLRVLSGGERSRCVLAGLVASAKNLLVLDEPTNHLDIPSAERLERSLLDYGGDTDDGGSGGALLLISHDRALLQAVCDKLVILDGKGAARVFEGRYSDYLAKFPPPARERVHEGELNPKPSAAKPAQRANERSGGKPSSSAATNPTSTNATLTNKTGKGAFSKLSTEELEKRIESLESKLRAVDSQLANSATWSDATKAKDLAAQRERVASDLAPLEAEWARRA
ncbi:MAG: ABC-F family ATP-binding cassette domain-containing protein [Phycisphaerae bacterium]|nr:ABC-F family ATP-binding cassette domain-containing protein [Phycisphaerae bacterium]